MSLLFIVIGAFVFVTSIKQLHKLNRYEFENRTNGGKVQFKTYEDSIKHSSKKQLWRIAWLVSALVTLFAVAAFLDR